MIRERRKAGLPPLDQSRTCPTPAPPPASPLEGGGVLDLEPWSLAACRDLETCCPRSGARPGAGPGAGPGGQDATLQRIRLTRGPVCCVAARFLLRCGGFPRGAQSAILDNFAQRPRGKRPHSSTYGGERGSNAPLFGDFGLRSPRFLCIRADQPRHPHDQPGFRASGLLRCSTAQHRGQCCGAAFHPRIAHHIFLRRSRAACALRAD